MSIRSMLKTGKQNATYCNILDMTDISDDQGGYTSTDAVVYYDVLCRFNTLQTKESIIAYDKASTLADSLVFLEYLSGLKEGQRLKKLDDDREFTIKLIMDWDEDQNYMKLAVQEIERSED